VKAALDIKERNYGSYGEEKIGEIAFSSSRKLMSTVHKFGNKYRIITKGAPDVLINKCTRFYDNGTVNILQSIEREEIKNINEIMASKALRVIAVGYADLEVLPVNINENMEKNLVFVGLIGMIDPPREGVKEAINTCHHAGIRTVMITGDHVITAKAIAKDLGMLKSGDIAVTGEELDKMSQDKLVRNISRYSVFARVSPEHKVRIVKALRSNGSVVAMTGDGVNDAPALKNADIGIAMGLSRY
jgi:Ca2+-transporting ATPase